jgi:PAS domain S-box-containing protein
VTLEAAVSGYKMPQIFGDGPIFPIKQTPSSSAELRTDRERPTRAPIGGEESYRLLFDKSPIPSWVFDRQTLAFLAVNDAAICRYGFSRQEMLGLTIKDVHAADEVPGLLAVVVGAGEEKTGAWTTRKKDGTVVSVEVAWQDVDFGGRPARLVLVRDITPRNQAGEDFHDSGRCKDDFLAVLAHELRNPLAPIRYALQVLKQPGVGGPTAERLREMMERQVAHLSRMVEDLVVVSRLTQGRIVLRKETVNAAVLLGRAAEAMQPRFEERRQILTVCAPAELRLEVDLTRLEQVLLNLLHNAAKYTDPGGRIWLSAEREGGEAVFRVKDAGIGIAAAMLPFIFDPLVQVERRLDRSRGGVGIGLTLVRKLVELHGGTVEAYSAGAGRGAEFVIRLPRTCVDT